MDRLALRKIFRLIETFRSLDSEMPVQQVATFLYVAMNDGNEINVQSIGKATGQGSSSTSRNIAALSKFQRFNKPGLDLIEARESPVDRRYKTVHLTDKGKEFAKNLVILSE